jgi:hypothetical protein
MLNSFLQSLQMLHMLLFFICWPLFPICIFVNFLVLRTLLIINPLITSFFDLMYSFLKFSELLILRTFQLVLQMNVFSFILLLQLIFSFSVNMSLWRFSCVERWLCSIKQCIMADHV